MTKRLWLVEIPDNVNREKDILLGPWCVLGKEDKHPDLHKLVFEPDAFLNFEEVSLAEEKIAEFTKYYIHKLSKKLNQLLKVNYSLEYWRILLYPWLLNVAQVTWERQIIINRVLDKYRNESIEVNLATDAMDIDVYNTLEFVMLSQNLQFNHWLFSRLIEKKIPENWAVTYTKIKLVKEYKLPNEKFKEKIHQYL